MFRALSFSFPRAVRWNDYCSRTLNFFARHGLLGDLDTSYRIRLLSPVGVGTKPDHELNEFYRIRLRSSGTLNVPGPTQLEFISLDRGIFESFPESFCRRQKYLGLGLGLRSQ